MRTLACLFVLVALTICASFPAHAEGLVLGAKAGVNVAKLTGEGEDTDWRTAAVGGVFLTWPIGKFFAIQPEALFSMKGAKEQVEIETVPVDLTVKITYFEIPILARVNIPTAGTVDPYVFAGPAFAFKMSSKAEAEAGGLSAEADLDIFKSSDIGIVAGAGLEFQLTSFRILFEGRYEAGLTSIDDTGLDADIKNATVSFMAGVGFAF